MDIFTFYFSTLVAYAVTFGFLAVIIHEQGHYWAAIAVGEKAKLAWTAVGLARDISIERPKAYLTIVAMGPMANIIAAVAAMLVWAFLAELSNATLQQAIYGALTGFVSANLVIAYRQLVPRVAKDGHTSDGYKIRETLHRLKQR